MTATSQLLYRLGVISTVALLLGENAFAAKAGHGPDSSGGLPQFDPEWFASQIFWLAIAFLVMYLWFSRKTLPEISGVLENRNDHIQSDLDTADRLTREAGQVQAAYEAGLAKASEEATQIIADVEETIKTKSAQSLQSLKERSERDIATAESRIANARNDALKQIGFVSAELAVQATEKIIGIKIDPEEARIVVEQLSNNEQAKAA